MHAPENPWRAMPAAENQPDCIRSLRGYRDRRALNGSAGKKEDPAIGGTTPMAGPDC
jgi:hypothetical protein